MPNALKFAEIVKVLLDHDNSSLAEELKKLGVSNGIVMSISVARSTVNGQIVQSEPEKYVLR